ncbi:hypothetical protein BD289DRAFT_335566, partial [Coniella lustricola]
VLVDMHAASLNYRDIAISKGKVPGAIPLAAAPDIVPGSDGAGVVIAVGSAVDTTTSPWLKPGSKVVMHMVRGKDNEYMPMMQDISDGLGQQLDGTLCRQGVFHHSCLVPMPQHLSFAEAATLTCSGLTAWNALFGAPGREVKEGDWVLVQGTGGVSIAALQMAVAAGATVIAITSTDSRAEQMHALGAKHVINYKTQTNWGAVAKSLTPDQRGVDHVVDVVGVKTFAQDLAAIRTHGLVTVAGMLGGADDNDPGMMSTLWHLATYRGILLGSRQMFLDMNAFLEAKKVKLALDGVVFNLEDALGAFERLQRWEHFSKVVIKM